MLVHKSPLDAREEIYLLQSLRDQIGMKLYPLHRLDKATSGLVLFAKDPKFVSPLQKLWEENKIEKTYYALVRGWLEEEVLVEKPLEEMARKRDQKKASDAVLKPAKSLITPLENYEWDYEIGKFPSQRYQLVRVKIYTGRKHQIRRHLVHLRHPIIGDTTYGDNKHNKAIRSLSPEAGLMLQAFKLSFPCPFHLCLMDFELPLCPRIQAHLVQMKPAKK